MGACISLHARQILDSKCGAIQSVTGCASISGSSRWSSRRLKKKKRGQDADDKYDSSGDAAFIDVKLVRAGSLREDELHRVPGRMFLNGSSEISCLFSQQGKKGTNQDAMLVWENFASRSDAVLCGVFDGHGPYGHMVAKKVRDSLPLKLYACWKAALSDDSLIGSSSILGSMNSEETASVCLDDEGSESMEAEESGKSFELYSTLKQYFLKAFKLMDKELKFHTNIDCFCSGTTSVILVKQGQHLVIGNVGDSRAILATRDVDNTLSAVQLTVDLKPNLPREAARIRKCKGRVFSLQDEPDVARVWLPNNDSPGLAMARAFGDFCLKDFGLISVPEISYRRLTSKDEFIVLATDGVWDVLSNKEVVEVVASAASRLTAARALVDSAVRAWRLKFPTSKIDDCAVVCLFLDPSSECPETSMATAEVQFEDEKDDHNLGKCTDAPLSEPRVPRMSERCHSRSLAECIATSDAEDWSALEGVTRVNSLLNLPRFATGDRKVGSWRRWL